MKSAPHFLAMTRRIGKRNVNSAITHPGFSDESYNAIISYGCFLAR